MLKLSEVFVVRSLQELLEAQFIDRLRNKPEVKLALHYLQLAARNKLERLANECLLVLRKNKEILVYTAAWNELLDKNPALLVDVFCGNEENVDELQE